MRIKTACPLDCWDTCSIIAHVEEGQVKKLEGDPEHPVTQGFLCTKGRRLNERMYSPHRILRPQKKVDGQWHDVSWHEALTEITGRVREAISAHGHHSILHVYDWGSGTVLKNLNQRFFYLLGGCTETVGSLCWEAGLEAQRYDFGQARSHAPQDMQNANGVVVWGRNVATTNIHMTPFLKDAFARGAQLVIVNPLPTDLDARATLKISPRPGSDGALALGVLNYCAKQGWLDTAFLDRFSVGWTEFYDYVRDFTLEKAALLTDVPVEDIKSLAEFYGTVSPVSTLLGLGLQRYPGGGNAIRAIDALVAATGHLGRPGGGVNYANRLISEFLDQDALTLRGDADVLEFSRGEQAEQILAASPAIKVMFITRTNSVTQVPDTKRLLEAYSTVPCKVAIDMFMTPTAQEADYFLPCTTVLEEEDFVFSTMWHSYITYMHRVVEPQGEAKPDWEIFAMLADYLGFGEQMRKPVDEWFHLVLRPLMAHGITLDDLRRNGTVRVPIPDVPWADYKFVTPSGKFEFVSERAEEEGHSGHATFIPGHEVGSIGGQTEQGGRYPFALLTIHPRLSENSQHRNFPNLPEYPTVVVTDVVAQLRNLTDGGMARLWNDQAELLVQVAIQDGGHPYTVKLESGWWGQGITINHFTKPYRADFGQQTAQYDCTCDIEPVLMP